MKTLDYSKLQPLSKNTKTNKSTNSELSSSCLLALLDYQANFEETLRNMSVYDSTSLLIAEQDWLKRRNYTSFKGSISKGQICKVDFGKTYSKENAFVHYALVVNTYKGKILVIPSTTSADQISKAFHPIHNENGEYRLRLADTSEGFSNKAALFMNDAKFISAGRILGAFEIIDQTAFDEIQEHLIKVMFPDYFKNIVQALVSENTNLISENTSLKEETESLKEEIQNLKNQLIV